MLPSFLHFSPYFRLMRLHQPIGIWLLYWPCAFTIILHGTYHDYWLLVIFLLGALCMRAAGCIINDIWDRKLDAKVARTKDRPLASGELTLFQALVLLAILLLLSACLALTLPREAILWAMISLVPVIIYPAMKRITYWPQIFLGITFNWGVLLASAVFGQALTVTTLTLYAACFFWTLGYDTIYAMQDKTDDPQAGIKSTALALQRHLKPSLMLFYGACLLLLIGTGWLAGFSALFYLILLLVALHFAWQIRSLDNNAALIFKSNGLAGGLIFLAFLMEKIL